MIESYDPNITWARHTFEVTFMQWDYSLTTQVEVCGNCKGISMSTAISVIFEECFDDDEQNAQIVLKRAAEDGDGEDTLEVDLEDESDLERLCVGIKIVEHAQEPKP